MQLDVRAAGLEPDLLPVRRFAGSLNMALAWLEGYYTAETAGQFVGLIEREMSGEKVVANHDLVEV